ncbi:MAG: hypothetical protein DCF21_09400 [Leptolyngbya sp.]|nr:MAG: hypothetical protein DCF21_09400 [Leptolyngbya sp.]
MRPSLSSNFFIKIYRAKIMLNITIDEIQRDPLKYLRQVEAGETLMIFRADQAIIKLKLITI